MPAEQKEPRAKTNPVITLFAVVIAVVAVTIVLAAIIRVYHDYSLLQETEAERLRCEADIRQLMDGSDYLTEQVFKYGETRNPSYMERYWREIEFYRRRDKAVEDIFLSNLDESDKERAAAAKQQSDELSVLETRAMRLIAESSDIPEAEMPKAVAEYQLTPAEEALSSEEKYELGLNYLHSVTYSDSKEAIGDYVERFRSDVNRKYGELSVQIANNTRNTVHIEGLVFVVMVALLIISVTAYRKEIKKRDEKLQAALEYANNANKMKGMFLTQVSHDMRTPLTAIIGFSENTDNLSADEARENLRKINTSGNHLLVLINDLLDTSKLESGNLALNYSATGFNDVLSVISSTIMPAAEKKNIEFTVVADEINDILLMVDELRLNQILLNLLNNAISYTPEGGKVDFEVTTLEVTPDSQTNRFIIRDNGCGMSKDFQKKMYRAFSRENYGTYGSGLGLTIVKELIDLMGGTISVESAPGEGTEFTVVLTSPIATPEDMARRQAHGGINLSALVGKKALMVEDNEINAGLAKRLLESRGLFVDIATDGKAALEKFSLSPEGCYDLILMDVTMPVMNGLECTRHIRALDRTDAHAIPIIALSANSFDENARECLDAGMNAHLSKPIDTEAMFRLLSELLS